MWSLGLLDCGGLIMQISSHHAALRTRDLAATERDCLIAAWAVRELADCMPLAGGSSAAAVGVGEVAAAAEGRGDAGGSCPCQDTLRWQTAQAA